MKLLQVILLCSLTVYSYGQEQSNDDIEKALEKELQELIELAEKERSEQTQLSSKFSSDSIFQSIEQQNQAKQLAELWVMELTKGENIDTLMSISTVPFALDGKKILNTKNELKELYKKVVDKKGKREVPALSSEIYKSKFEIIEKSIPLNVLLVKIEIKDGKNAGEAILVSVQISDDKLKIIGFRD